MTIVVGVDNGPGGQLAVRWAVAEALLRGRPLRVVHVSTGPGDVAEPMPAGRLRAAAPGLRGFLDAVAYARDRLPDGMLSAIHPPGRPARVLVEESARDELLVVGCGRGRTPLPTTVGSVGAAVVAHARPSTVVVGASEDEDVERKHVVVGVDGSRRAGEAMAFAAAEARLRRTDLVVVRGRDTAGLIDHTRTAELTVLGSTGRRVVRHARGPVAVVH